MIKILSLVFFWNIDFSLVGVRSVDDRYVDLSHAWLIESPIKVLTCHLYLAFLLLCLWLSTQWPPFSKTHDDIDPDCRSCLVLARREKTLLSVQEKKSFQVFLLWYDVKERKKTDIDMSSMSNARLGIRWLSLLPNGDVFVAHSLDHSAALVNQSKA